MRQPGLKVRTGLVVPQSTGRLLAPPVEVHAPGWTGGDVLLLGLVAVAASWAIWWLL